MHIRALREYFVTYLKDGFFLLQYFHKVIHLWMRKFIILNSRAVTMGPA